MTESKITAKLYKQMQKEYIEIGGCRCPTCNSYNLDGYAIEPPEGDSIVTQKIVCLDCKSTWTDLYKLSGFNNLVRSEEAPKPKFIVKKASIVPTSEGSYEAIPQDDKKEEQK